MCNYLCSLLLTLNKNTAKLGFLCLQWERERDGEEKELISTETFVVKPVTTNWGKQNRFICRAPFINKASAYIVVTQNETTNKNKRLGFSGTKTKLRVETGNYRFWYTYTQTFPSNATVSAKTISCQVKMTRFNWGNFPQWLAVTCTSEKCYCCWNS